VIGAKRRKPSHSQFVRRPSRRRLRAVELEFAGIAGHAVQGEFGDCRVTDAVVPGSDMQRLMMTADSPAVPIFEDTRLTMSAALHFKSNCKVEMAILGAED
jgi:hypothetical protein